jgi:hypothetical protein
VIDGVQRLTTIKRFFNNDFELEGLTTFKELEGKKFSQIGDFGTELESTTIRCIVLRKDNPKQLVREIFSRLNQGAVELSDQEIRHAIYSGSLDLLLEELGKHPLILRFGLGENSEKTKDGREPDEQVLRFFAFSDNLSLNKFDGNLRLFLDEYMEENANADENWIQIKKETFHKAIGNCEAVFGDDVFTNLAAGRKRKGLVHYDLLMPTVGLLDCNHAQDKSDNIKNAYRTLCESEYFQRTLSGGLQNRASIIRRRELWFELLEKALNDA